MTKRQHREGQVQCAEGDGEGPSWIPSVKDHPIGNGNESDEDFEERNQIRPTPPITRPINPKRG